jgi:hypothetical protein
VLYQHPLDPLDPERLDDAERWQEYDTKKKESLFHRTRTIVCLEAAR